MRILILGGNGMLGHQLLLSFSEKHEVKVTVRGHLDDYLKYGLFTTENIYSGIDVSSIMELEKIISDYNPDVVINAAGIIKQREDAKAYIPSIEINSLFPHKLAKITKPVGVRLIHISTDCVFSGDKGNYSEEDTPDSRDLYGLSKYLGEVSENHCLSLRTSIIGLELANKKSLIEWFLAQSGEIKGFRKAIYTGITTIEFARICEEIIINHPKLRGVFHIASKPITKYDLLSMLSDLLGRDDIIILPDDEFVCNRSLNSGRFTKETGYIVPSWDNMLQELVEKIKLRGNGVLI